MKKRSFEILVTISLIGVGVGLPSAGWGHCDTMDGPVVQSARAALEAKDITPVLKWVHDDGEAEVKAAFARSLAVRDQGAPARDLADQYFFETLVRVHRAGEGAPYTGLKPAGTKLEPGIAEADEAIGRGSVDGLVEAVTRVVADGIRKRFAAVQERAKHADHNVAAGREFVAAYVEYVHYVEGVQRVAGGSGHHGGGERSQGECQRHASASVSEHKH